MRIADVWTYVLAKLPPYHGDAYFVFLTRTTDDKIERFGKVYRGPSILTK